MSISSGWEARSGNYVRRIFFIVHWKENITIAVGHCDIIWSYSYLNIYFQRSHLILFADMTENVEENGDVKYIRSCR